MEVKHIRAEFEEDYARLEHEVPDTIDRLKQQFDLCTASIALLKESYLSDNSWCGKAEGQISMFKEIKPFVEARLFFCMDAIRFEVDCPHESPTLAIPYCEQVLQACRSYLDEHQDYHHYIELGSSLTDK